MGYFLAWYVVVGMVVSSLLTAMCITSPDESRRNYVSWGVIAIASIFWIITIPISALELLADRATKKPTHFGDRRRF